MKKQAKYSLVKSNGEAALKLFNKGCWEQISVTNKYAAIAELCARIGQTFEYLPDGESIDITFEINDTNI